VVLNHGKRITTAFPVIDPGMMEIERGAMVDEPEAPVPHQQVRVARRAIDVGYISVEPDDFGGEVRLGLLDNRVECDRAGQVVKAQVLALDPEKRLIRLSMKQLVPTGLDEYLAEHKEGDIVTGRMVEISDGRARVELGEGVVATCRMPEEKPAQEDKRAEPDSPSSSKPDLSSLGSMLQERWKSGAAADEAKTEVVRAGQIRKFRIAKLDVASKKIELKVE